MTPLLLIIGLLQSAPPDPERGRPEVQNHSPRAYAGSPQNWGLVEDARGVLYVANNSRILEYDGVRWRTLQTPHQAAARSLAVGRDRRVYVGCVGDFGRLEPDAHGDLKYVSLLERVPAADRGFGDVWKTYATDAGVFFQSFTHLFRVDETGVRVWRPPTGRFHLSFVVRDTLYIRVQGQGLLRLDGDTLLPMADGARFADERVYAMLPAADGRILIGTRTQGLFLHDGTKATPIAEATGVWLQDAQLYHGLRLADGRYALATLKAGVAIVDGQGAILEVLDKSSGLRDANVKYLFTDRRSGLWLALSNGLARVAIGRPRSLYGEREGLDGIVLDLERHQGELYAATNQGLRRLVPAAVATERARFVEVPGVADQTWDLLSTGDTLLIGTNRGLRALRGGVLTPLSSERTYALLTPRAQPEWVYAAQRNGVHRFTLGPDGWVDDGRVEGTEGIARSLGEDAAAGLWIGYLPEGARRLAPSGDAVERYGAAAGLAGELTHFFTLRAPVLGGTRMIMENDARLLRPEGEALVDLHAERWGIPSRLGIQALAQDAEGALWLSAGSVGQPAVGVARPAGDGYTWDDRLTASVPFAYAVYAEDDAVWFGGESLVRIRTQMGEGPEPTFTTLIRSAAAKGIDAPLYAGAGRPMAPELEYVNNGLRFEFAAPAFDDEKRVRYRFRLDGFDTDWSAWASETRKEYSNLEPGAYTFRTQGRDGEGRLATEAAWRFSIAPPWYRTTWAVAAYVLLGGLLLIGVVRAWTWRLRQQNIELERIVAERTAEISEKNAENERLLLNILPGPIAERLKRGEKTIADKFESVTVLFADVVGFTMLSSRVSSSELVELLNDLFTEIDRLAAREGVEKIKTIGDAYMAVAGVPDPLTDHADRAGRMALGMLAVLDDFNAQHGTELNMRIGLHTGPVVAGVIGEHKFIYDLWGDTVNVASRMESHGEPGRVQISASTQVVLSEGFDVELRGEILVKGKGAMQTWWLKGA